MNAPVNKKSPAAKEIAATYADIAQRSAKLLYKHTKRQIKKGIAPPAGELGIGDRRLAKLQGFVKVPDQKPRLRRVGDDGVCRH